MAFENSPSLEEFEEGIPVKLSDPSAKRKRRRILLVLLLGMLLLLAGTKFAQSDAATLLAGKGSVAGQAIDENGNPFQGTVMVLGTELEIATQPDGSFLLENIPQGARVLVLANDHAGYEFPVQVIAGDMVSIGQIQFASTATP